MSGRKRRRHLLVPSTSAQRLTDSNGLRLPQWLVNRCGWQRASALGTRQAERVTCPDCLQRMADEVSAMLRRT